MDQFPGVLFMEPAAPRNRRVIFADPAARLAGRALRHHDAPAFGQGRVRPGT
jgi:hypothetical protein